jgi:hypothetical protein
MTEFGGGGTDSIRVVYPEGYNEMREDNINLNLYKFRI